MMNYKTNLLQMVAEMQEHQAIYAYAFFSRMFGHERDPDNMPDHMKRSEIYISSIISDIAKLNTEDLGFIATLTDKMLMEQRKVAEKENIAV